MISQIIKRTLRKLYFYPLLKKYRASDCKAVIDADAARWSEEMHFNEPSEESTLTKVLTNDIFRYIFFWRTKTESKWLKKIYKPYPYLFISPSVEHIDGGLFFYHPWMTYLYCRRIGKNATFRQLTTLGNLGKERSDALATIGDNVEFGVNVTIIGNIKIGNNVKLGAGTVIVKDVPDNCTVVGNPAIIVRKDGQRCHIPL